LGSTLTKLGLKRIFAGKTSALVFDLDACTEKTPCSLVLYEADSEVTVDAFMPHSHPGGEAYIVLEGEVWDEDGTYPAGSLVWMNRETTHTPKTRGKTLILVLWPEGVKSA
jgi:predicted 2-oxoglutarate/Fe(II)-dependent dioxygenase YbiX